MRLREGQAAHSVSGLELYKWVPAEGENETEMEDKIKQKALMLV